MLDKLRQMEENYHAMQEKMMDPDVVGDNQQYAQLMREYKHMQPIMEKYHEYLQAQRDFTEAKELLDSETDPNSGRWHRQNWNRAVRQWRPCRKN